MSDINITGLNKAALLAGLYNASSPQGLGFLHFDPKPMTTEDAQAEINSICAYHREHGFSGQPSLYFDYFKGRCMKIDITGDTLHPSSFDRDNGGDGTCQRIVNAVRAGALATLAPDADVFAQAVNNARSYVGTKTTSDNTGGVHRISLGLDELSAPLAEALDRLPQE